MNIVFHLLGIGIAGGLGSLARFGVSLGASALFGPGYPWGTCIVNMLGCLLFGMVAQLAVNGWFSPYWRLILLTGFLGGFTTFSTFAFENQHLLVTGRWGALALNMLGQNVLGILAVLLGLYLSSQLLNWL